MTDSDSRRMSITEIYEVLSPVFIMFLDEYDLHDEFKANMGNPSPVWTHRRSFLLNYRYLSQLWAMDILGPTEFSQKHRREWKSFIDAWESL